MYTLLPLMAPLYPLVALLVPGAGPSREGTFAIRSLLRGHYLPLVEGAEDRHYPKQE